MSTKLQNSVEVVMTVKIQYDSLCIRPIQRRLLLDCERQSKELDFSAAKHRTSRIETRDASKHKVVLFRKLMSHPTEHLCTKAMTHKMKRRQIEPNQLHLPKSCHDKPRDIVNFHRDINVVDAGRVLAPVNGDDIVIASGYVGLDHCSRADWQEATSPSMHVDDCRSGLAKMSRAFESCKIAIDSRDSCVGSVRAVEYQVDAIDGLR
jgi:hypothetical protein